MAAQAGIVRGQYVILRGRASGSPHVAIAARDVHILVCLVGEDDFLRFRLLRVPDLNFLRPSRRVTLQAIG